MKNAQKSKTQGPSKKVPAVPVEPPLDGKKSFLCGTALILLSLVVYIPALNGAFLWDDVVMVQENQLVTHAMNLKTIWFRTDFPLSLIFLWVEWLFFGGNTVGYHVINALLHGLGAILLWRVLRSLRIRGAWLAGAIFAVHPVCVASVAWISELKNTLSLVLFLLSALWYLRSENPKSNRWYWLALAIFLLALLAKTSTVMLPVVLLVCAWWEKNQISRRDLLRTAPFFALALAFGLMTVWFQSHQAIGGEVVQRENLLDRLAGAGWAAGFYFYKAVLPIHLSMIYPRWEINAASAISWLPDLLLGALVVLFWWNRRSWGKHALCALAVFIVLLFPVLGFFDMYFLVYSRVADHFQYLALIAVIALAAAAIETKLKTASFKLAAIVLIAILGTLTWQRARVFKSEEKLWGDTLQKNPRAWCAHNNLGNALSDMGKTREAITHYSESLQINPASSDAHNNLGVALVKEGKIDEAIIHHNTALKLNPRQPKFHFNLGIALARAQRFDDAVTEYQTALRLKPDYADAHNNLANVLNKQGKNHEALKQASEALRLKQKFPEAHFNAANALLALGKRDEAFGHFTTAVQLKPDFAEAHFAWGMELASTGKMDEAAQHFREAALLNPNDAVARVSLGNALAAQGKFEDATMEYRAALKTQPGDAQAHNNLGNVFAAQGKMDDAIAEYRAALKLNGGDPEPHFNLGLALLRKGERGEAREHFAEVLRLKPDYTAARQQLDALSVAPK